jgi:HK97 gp10 family phage protein
MTLVARIDLTGLERLTKEMEPRAEKVLDDTAFQVETEAKNSAPVLTGALRNSIHVEKPGRLYRTVGDSVDYGIYQELGTSRMAAQPFLVPAVEKVRAKFEKMWEALFK